MIDAQQEEGYCIAEHIEVCSAIHHVCASLTHED